VWNQACELLFNMLTKKLKQSLWFTEQFQQLHQTGIGFIQSLALLERTCPDSDFRIVIRQVYRSVKKGRAFSHSLKQHSAYFSETYLAMIAVGERSGSLSQVLIELAAYLNLHLRLRQSVIQALTYPCLILALMFFMLLFLLYFVIPQFEAIFAQFKAPLPWLTSTLFAFVHHLKFFGCSLIVLSMLGGVFLRKSLKRHWQHFKKKIYLLHCPGLGRYYQDWLLMFLFKTLGLSLKSGLSLQESLQLLPKLFGATPFSQLIWLLQKALQEGRPLEKIFDQPEYLPEICSAYINIASVSGALDQKFIHLAQYFESRVYHTINQFKVLLEPLILLITGGLVGLIVIALYQPLFNLGGLM
jgi:protein transport protein HofC